MKNIIIMFIISLIIFCLLSFLTLKTRFAYIFINSEISKDVKNGKFDLYVMKRIASKSLLLYPFIIAIMYYGYVEGNKFIIFLGILIFFINLLGCEIYGIVKGYGKNLYIKEDKEEKNN